MKSRKRTVLTLERLEDRCCPSGGGGGPDDVGGQGIAWKPVDAGNLYSDKNNWSNKTVPTNGAMAVFNAAVSNAPCNVDVNPNTPFSLSGDYTGLITFGTNNLKTAELTGISEGNPTTDSFNAKILDGCSVGLIGGTSTLYNCNIAVADNNVSPFILTNGAVLNLDTTTGLTENISDEILVTGNTGGTLNIGDPQFKSALSTIQWTPVVNTNQGALVTSSALIVSTASGVVNIYGANSNATLIDTGVSSSYLYTYTSPAQMNFWGGHDGVTTAINAGLVADSGGTIDFYNGSGWNFNGYCSAVGYGSDSIVLDPKSAVPSTLNLNGDASHATTLDLLVESPGYFEDINGNVNVYSNTVNGKSATLSCYNQEIFHTGTLTFKQECTLEGYNFQFAPTAGDSFSIVELIDSKGNSSMILTATGYTISFGTGTSLTVTQTDPQNQLPGNKSWVLFAAEEGILGEIAAAMQTLPKGTAWFDNGSQAGVQT